jgi:hypothetical protein
LQLFGGTSQGEFRCPVQILGLDKDDAIYAPFGEDPFVALQYAIDLIGDLLKERSERLGLENLCFAKTTSGWKRT